jgi:hypothetical protein
MARGLNPGQCGKKPACNCLQYKCASKNADSKSNYWDPCIIFDSTKTIPRKAMPCICYDHPLLKEGESTAVGSVPEN